MVFRSIWRGPEQQQPRTEGPGTEATGMSDQELMAQAIQDDKQTKNLIAIENARGTMRLKQIIAIGSMALAGLVVVVVPAMVVFHAAADLKLPWHRIVTVVGTVLGSSGVSGLVAWQVRKRILKHRQAAAQSQNPQAGDPDQVGTA